MAGIALRIPPRESAPGAVCLNYCDPWCPRPRGMPLTAMEALIRVVAYVPFTPQVIVASEYVFSNQLILDAFRKASPLLEEGVLIPDIWNEAGSFADMAVLQHEADRTFAVVAAEFLDQHAAAVHEYEGIGMGDAYRRLLISDVAPEGPLRRAVGSSKRVGSRYTVAFDRAHDRLCRTPVVGRNDFINIVTEELAGKHTVVRRWAALRYYTTPHLFDAEPVRELPDAMETLLRAADFPRGWTLGAPLPDPIGETARRLSLLLPSLDPSWFDNGEALAVAALKAREAVPEAQTAFRKTLDICERNALQAEVNARFNDEYARELGRRAPRFSFRRGIPITALGLGVTLDLLNFTPSANAAMNLGLAATEALTANIIERRSTRRDRPWSLVIAKMQRELTRQLRAKRPATEAINTHNK